MLKRLVTIVIVLLRPSCCSFCPKEGLRSNSIMTTSEQTFQHLEKIRGRSEDYLNNVLFSRVPQATGTVIYFGGDVQNLSELMEAHRDHHRYLQWSLERVGTLLRQAFPDKNVVIIRPARFERATFSCFDNFVQSNWCGAPTHLEDPNKLEALEQLRGILYSLQQINSDECGLVNSKKILIGFSKGVVVLNQILHEISALQGLKTEEGREGSQTDDQKELALFSNSIFAMSWLDGGHNGGKDTWITSLKILQSLAHHGMKVDVRVTPYQIRDDRRPWIGKEEKKFVAFLTREMCKDKFRRKIFFENEEPCLENHFKILETFKQDDQFFLLFIFVGLLILPLQ